jgi:hypothetical protein
MCLTAFSDIFGISFWITVGSPGDGEGEGAIGSGNKNREVGSGRWEVGGGKWKRGSSININREKVERM